MQYNEDSIYWLALQRIPRLGPVALRRHWGKLQKVKSMWEELSSEVVGASFYLDAAAQEYQAVVSQNIQILTLSHENYPKQLRNLSDITPILYLKGNLISQDNQAVSIVGTRHPSRYGVEVTQRLTRQLVASEFTIISGMAKGIDAVAHWAAIEAGGRTIAVWGSGLDCIYPPEHSKLADQILQHGAIISQFPLGTAAQSFTFPERNKLIAGLSQTIIVTEAQEKSGSLLTAEAGLRYGRKIGAVPGSIFSGGSAGPSQLIKNGASLVVDAADIVDRMAPANGTYRPKHSPDISVSVSEQAILDQLQAGPQHIDELIRQSTQSAAETVSILAMLEIKGVIKQLAPGEYFIN